MADRKISDLTALTTPAAGDYLPIVDISEASAANKNKRITIEELLRGAPDGTAAAPSIGFESDPNTGIYRPGADQVAISTNGTGRLFVDANGNVGIGTTSFGGKLTVKTSSSNGAPVAWGDGQLVVTAGDGTTAPGFGISTNTSDNSVSLSALTPGTGWNNLHLRAAQTIFYKSDAASNEVGRWDASGRLLVGTSSVRASFQRPSINVEGLNDSGITICRNNADASGPVLEFGKTRSTSIGGVTAVSNNDFLGLIRFYGANGSTLDNEAARISAEVDGTVSGGGANDMPGRLVFSTTADGASSPTERLRITQSGNVTIGSDGNITLFNQASVTGAVIERAGAMQLARSGDQSLLINRISDDGTLVGFYQDGTQEGSISVSGSTVSYNGAHLSRWSQLPSGAERTEILRGSVLSNLDEMCEWGEEENEQLNRMKVSDVEGDKNVSGVFQAWDDDDDTYTNDFCCAMTGDFIIRIAEGVTVERGDLLMSAGDGTAKPQDDDIIRSKTIAKVTSTNVSCTYEDGSYCVPCVLMAC